MKVASYYDAVTGLFHRQRFEASSSWKDFASAAELNAPPGHKWIEGAYDHLAQRVDLETGKVVEYVPPQPDADHEWNAETKRWQKRADVVEREQRRVSALAQIADLERRQLRPQRELLLDPSSREADVRLHEIEAQIASLRGSL
jgi:hypothetical protein